jgi:hypothetical protein
MLRVKYLIQKFNPVEIPKEVKLYISIVSYLPNFFGQIIANNEFSKIKNEGYDEVKFLLDKN